MNGAPRLLVVSHPGVVAVNQLPYAALVERGWSVLVITPDRWRHEYSAGDLPPETHPKLDGRHVPLPVLGAGLVQRHLYLADPVGVLRRLRPDVVFVESEGFSVPAGQWGLAAMICRVPFGVQADENLNRSLPVPARLIRRAVLPRAAFVAARSPTAAELVRRWGAGGLVRLIPHHVPAWPATDGGPEGGFRVGFAGRLVPEKGLGDLVAAVRRLDPGVELVVAGDGPMCGWLKEADLGAARLRLLTNLDHDSMHEAYAQMDVLVLPSLTTPTWVEQFGRVLVEALWCRVPVVGSDSGEIPWVVETTGGGRVFPEGDAAELAEVLSELRSHPDTRERLAAEGRRRVKEMFSVEAVADAYDRALETALVRGPA